MAADHRLNGWAGLVEDAGADSDEALEEAKTDPQFEVPDMTPAVPPRHRLKLPLPGGALTAAAQPSSDTASKPRLPIKSAADLGNLGSDLSERLLEESPPPVPVASGLREYRTAIATGIVGLVLFGGAIVIQQLSPSAPPQVQGAMPTSAPPTTTTPPTRLPISKTAPGAKQPTVQAATGRSTEGPRTPSAVPSPLQVPATSPAPVSGAVVPTQDAPAAGPSVRIISIITTPPGASVELDGVVHGKTPFVGKAPNETDRLHVRLELKRYKGWEQDVLPGETGHFTVKLDLEKQGR